MRHLSDAELVDAAEHSLTAARSGHLDSCDRCRAAVDRLASMLRHASTVDVPEPSPLFWDHFSARVHDAVAADGAAVTHRGRAPRWAPWVQVAGFCAIVVAVVSAAWFVRPSGDATRVSTMASRTDAQTASAVPNAPQEVADAADDPAWAVLSAAAADLSSESNHGVGDNVTSSAAFTVRPAAVDTAVQQLTPDERRELGALLQSELKRSSD